MGRLSRYGCRTGRRMGRHNVEPDKTPSEIMPTEPYLLGSHAGCAGFWVSGPSDVIEASGAPKEWDWGYNRMSTVNGLS